MSKKGWALIEYGGEWEDSWEYIIAVYLKKEKAERHKEEKNEFLAEAHAAIQKCWDCMRTNNFLEVEGFDNVKSLKEKLSEECNVFESSKTYEEDGYYALVCENDLTQDFRDDVSGYKIIEVSIEN